MVSICTPLAFIDGLGAPEMMLIFVLILVLFGGQKLPEFARGLGKSLREFKKAAAGVEEEFKRALEEDERKQNQLKLAENSSATSPVPDTSAGPVAPADSHHDPHHEQHYGDYSHETPAASPSPAEAGPENKIAAPVPPAAPAAPTGPIAEVYNDGPAPAPAAEPVKNPPPGTDAAKTP